MYCSECGAAVGANDTVCSKCGATVSPFDGPTTIGPSTPDSSPVPIATASAFRDPSKLTQWLKYLLYASIAIDLIALFSGILQYHLLSDFQSGVYSSQALAVAAAESNDKRQQIIGFLQLGITIATTILFAMWIYRAIPVLLLWKPYQAMKEIWQASKNPASWTTVKRGSILPWWWFFFLAAGLLGQATFRASLQAKEINELIRSTGIAMASDLVSIPATIIALVLVKQIYAMQMSHVQRRI
jgi:hypothetical protein